jgi:hypothetical protein
LIDDRGAAAVARGGQYTQTRGEVPERLNGRDWKSRNGGNLVRGFESPPLRRFFRQMDTDTARGIASKPGSREGLGTV